MSMKLLLGRGLALRSHDDPLRHTQARLLQRFALVMPAAALLSIPVSLVAQSAVERLTGVITALALVVLLGGALLLLGRGRQGPLDALTRLLASRNPSVRVIAIGTQPAKSRAIQQRPSFPMVAPHCTATELRAIVHSLLSAPPLAMRS